MIVHDVVQYSPPWWALRLGMATASRFGSIITDKKLKPSEGRFGLIAELLLEQQVGKPADFKEGDDVDVAGFERDGTPWMKRGSEIEAEARTWYRLHTGEKVNEVGFVTNDAGTAGCSPDGMTEDLLRGLEIKARSAKHHLRLVLGYDEIATASQVQGSMWVTGVSVWDVLAYCPGQPSRLDRFYRDPAFMAAFDKAWKLFEDGLKDAREKLERIEGDVVQFDNLGKLWSGALQKKPTRPCPLSLDDLAGFKAAVDRCLHLGLLDSTDFLRIVEDLWREDWESVEAMISYTTRALLATVEGVEHV